MQVLDSLLKRHQAFWTRSEVSQPLLTVVSPTPLAPLQIPTPAGVALQPEGYLLPEMLDPLHYFEQLTARWEGLGPTDGDQFRIMTAYWYVPWLEAICGCPIWFVRESGTMYSEPPKDDWDAVRNFRLTRNNPWLAKLREFYLVMGELAAGRYPLGVAMPMRGPLDLLGALIGVERMCLGFAESPQLVREALGIVTDVWIEVVGEQLALLPPFAGGMANCEQYGLWVPGTNAVTQCDLAVSISPRTYAQYLVPCDERICASLAYPIIHLHSVGLHVLEQVLSVNGFAAIQVVVDPGPKDPTVQELLPAFRRVQAAGRPLIIHCNTIAQADLNTLQAALSPRGLCIRTGIAEPPAAS